MAAEEIDLKLATVINWSFAALVFFLPLLLSIRSGEVFELPKMLFVYAMAAVIVGLWLSRMILRRKILIRRTPLDIPILLFLISQMVSTIYSIDPHVSWWGWYGRFHGGLWSTVSYTLLYYAFVSNISENSENSKIQRVRKSDNQKAGSSGFLNFRFSDIAGYQSIPSLLINSILLSGLVVSIYAILQHFGIDKNFWVQDVVNRVFSTQGQPNWLAGYLTMALPLTWAMTIIRDKGQRNSFGLWPLAFGIIYFLALLWTKSRSGLVGMAVADLVFWSLIFFCFYLKSFHLKKLPKNKSYIDHQRSFKQQPTFSGTNRLYRLSTIVHHLYNFGGLVKPFLLIHIIMVGLILATNNPARDWALRKLQATGDRRQATTGAALETGITLRKSEHGGTESGDIRRIVWTGALQLVKQRPWFGFGPETFGETYWRVRPKEHNLTSEWNFLYNKAHNEWLNLAANTGLFGLGSHLLLLTWFSVWTLRSFANFSAVEKFAKFNYLTAILAGLWGVEIVNFFGFSTVTVTTYQYLFMGLAVALNAPRNRDTPSSSLGSILSRSILKGLSLTVVAVAVFYILAQLFLFFLADLSYNRGRAYQDGGYIQEAIKPLIQAVNLAPREPVFRAELAEAEGALAAWLTARLTDNGEQITENLDLQRSDLPSDLKNDSIINFEIVRRQSPYNLGFIRSEAKVLFLLGEQDRALHLMKLAMELAPTNPQLPYSLGIMLDRIGKTEEAALYYNKALELKPDYADAIPISE